jgi:membrane protease YdiL (CAAX protease family)
VPTDTTYRRENVKKSLAQYFGLAFAITWLLDIPRLLADNNLAEIPGFLIFIQKNLAIFGPSLAAFILTFKSGGWQQVKRLWKRGWDFKSGKKWILVILLIQIGTNALTILIMQVTGHPIQWEYSQIPLQLVVPIFLAIYLLNGLPEEYGWRGYALDRLQTRWNALTASLILGFIHGIWHLPLHFMKGTTQEVIPIHEFILITMVGAIVYTWIYNSSKGNLFLMIFYHALGNTFGGLVPYWVSSEGRWIGFGVQLAIAVVIVIVYGAKNLATEAYKPNLEG